MRKTNSAHARIYLVVLTATGVIRLTPLWFEDLPNLDLERLTEAR